MTFEFIRLIGINEKIGIFLIWMHGEKELTGFQKTESNQQVLVEICQFLRFYSKRERAIAICLVILMPVKARQVPQSLEKESSHKGLDQ
ncbi:hypothetical protein [Pseudomonas cannabina]|uniref:hypothetical protein n=1 Tax=Pseudomonas cannabina TaxID=86840 RepID=UPI00111344B7|nr:hypothetical protein [Pseudomonas cannabina]KAA8716243.1 hypothetical protein F4W70_04190 [Pseudomonas cannabina]